MPITDEILTYTDAAKFLSIKLSTLYALVSQKRIPHVRLGSRFVRFRRNDLEMWLLEKQVHVIERDAR